MTIPDAGKWPKPDFQEWYVQCVAKCVNEYIGPDDYLWDLQNPGVWASLYDNGLSPEDAVASQFGTLQ